MNKTCQKGDVGLTQVIADLTLKGFGCFVPISNHTPVDLVGYKNGRCLSFQVKHRCLVDRRVHIQLSTVYSTKKGNVISPYDLSLFDYFAVFVPELVKCFYLPTKLLIEKGVGTITLNSDRPDDKLFIHNFANLEVT